MSSLRNKMTDDFMLDMLESQLKAIKKIVDVNVDLSKLVDLQGKRITRLENSLASVSSKVSMFLDPLG